jgi:DNA-binding transcriptional LysR family regulator
VLEKKPETAAIEGENGMQLKQLQFFVVSVDMGSFKAAAEVLYTSQPHVSKTIKALEEELKIPLLNRKAKGVVMTEEGRRVYEYAAQILRNMELIGKVQEEQDTDKFALSASFGAGLSSLYAEFYKKNVEKNIRLQFLEGTVEDVMQDLHKHRSEMGFVSISQHQYFAFQDILRYKRLGFHLMKKTSSCLFVGEAHSLYRMEKVSTEQLKKMKLIQPREEFFSAVSHLGHLKNSMDVFEKIPKAVITDSDDLILQMLTSTDLAYVGNYLMAERFSRAGIRAIPIVSGMDDVYFGYVKRIRDGLSPLGEEFVRFIKRAMQSPPPVC